MMRFKQRVSIYTWFGFYLPMAERLRLIKEAGFDSVMLWWEDGAGDDAGVGKTDVCGLARAAGLGVEYVHAPFYEADELWTGTAASAELERMYLDLIDYCGCTDIPTVVMHAAKVPHPHPVTRSGLEAFGRLIERAEIRGVNLAVENLDSADHLDQIFGSLKSQRLGFCFDSGHHNVASRDRNLLRDHADKLFALHLHDNDGLSDLHRIPGDGTVDWAAFRRDLEAAGYTGPIMLEVLNDNYTLNHEKIAGDAAAFLRLAYDRAAALRTF